MGFAALMRAVAEDGVIELGRIMLSPPLQRTVAATEELFLLMDLMLGQLRWRRLEWTCDSRNLPSRRAAQRLGFQYEGLFRRHMWARGFSRDSAWFSVLDYEWPVLRPAFLQWLDPANFDAAGQQRVALATLTAARRATLTDTAREPTLP